MIQQQQSQLAEAAQCLPLAASCSCHTSTRLVAAASFSTKHTSCHGHIATERKQPRLKVFKMSERDVSNFKDPIDEPNRAEAVQIVDGTLLRHEARVKRTQSTMLPWRLAQRAQ